MNQQIIVISWSHHQTPLGLRDKLALSKKEIRNCVHISLENEKIKEFWAFSTCNRIEFYALANDPDDVLYVIRDLYAHVLKRDIFWNEFPPEINIGLDAVNHLYRVASGMESMVLGECQILSQMAVTMNSLNKAHPESIVLRKLFLSAIECGEEVHKNTPISSEPASIGELAINVAKKTFRDLQSRTILILGAGAVAKLTAQKLIESRARHIIIANRNEKRGKYLAKSINLDYVNIDQLNHIMHKCDVVIAATHSKNYLIEKEQIEKIMNRRKETFLILDISTPRNVNPSIRNIDNVSLYDLDHLKVIASQNSEKHRGLLMKSDLIIRENSKAWMRWYQLNEQQKTILELVEERD